MKSGIYIIKNCTNGKVYVGSAVDGVFIKEFNSLDEAQKELNINNISFVCKGKRVTAGGFKFKYIC